MKIKLKNIIFSIAIICILGAIGIQNIDNMLYDSGSDGVKHISIKLNDEDSLPTKFIGEQLEPIKDDIFTYVNINTATKEELTSLSGIGDKTADAIIAYRQSNKFENIEDIKNVDGIGEKKFEEISGNITVN